MRVARIVIIAAASMLALCQGALGQTTWTTTLNGGSEVPPASTSASGNFDATLSADHTVMTFTLTYQSLKGMVTQARIHRGAAGTNGPAIYYLSPGAFASPLSGQTDPVPAGGAPGFLPEDYADLQAGQLYVNVATSVYPAGEIRGQIVSAVQANNETWGRIKALFR
jgi:hypothetical protein